MRLPWLSAYPVAAEADEWHAFAMGAHDITDTDSRIIRAIYTDRTIRVYQAYSPEIAIPAIRAGRFVPPFKMGRMTWIKPSFNWMMYRCGYAAKPGQERVLGIDITRAGFDWALANAALSHYIPAVHASPEAWREQVAASPVRIQWDPERDWRIHPIPHVRSLQMGLTGEAVHRYVNEWIVGIEDVTPFAHQAGKAVAANAAPPEALPCFFEREFPET